MTSAGLLREVWQAGVDAVRGAGAVAQVLPALERPDHILAVGKAASDMIRPALSRWPDVPCLVVTKDGHGAGLPSGCQLIEAAHPVPDARSLRGGRALRTAVAAMGPGARLLLLVSGGASALAEDPVAGKTLDDITALNQRLLASGKDIGTMNAERRRYSRIKGGGLLAHFGGAAVDVLAISDVRGDAIEVIGSGIGAAPRDHGFDYRVQIVASNALARQAAWSAAERQGQKVLRCEECLYGDISALAADLGPALGAMPPGLWILGGEPTTVLPDNPGRGGRNQALALALAEHIAGRRDIALLVGGTDGTDGPTQDAGALVTGTTWDHRARGAQARADSGSYLAQRGALLTTGPTGTNVMDLLIALRA